MIVGAIVVLVWLVLALAADLSAGVTVSGVVTAVVLASWERQKQLAAQLDEPSEDWEDESDEPFEQRPSFYV